MRVSVSLPPCQPRMLLSFWIFANMVSKEWYLSVVSICVSHSEWSWTSFHVKGYGADSCPPPYKTFHLYGPFLSDQVLASYFKSLKENLIGPPACDLVATPGAFGPDQLSIPVIQQGLDGSSQKAVSSHCMKDVEGIPVLKMCVGAQMAPSAKADTVWQFRHSIHISHWVPTMCKCWSRHHGGGNFLY